LVRCKIITYPKLPNIRTKRWAGAQLINKRFKNRTIIVFLNTAQSLRIRGTQFYARGYRSLNRVIRNFCAPLFGSLLF
jgi:hypothetical protein